MVQNPPLHVILGYLVQKRIKTLVLKGVNELWKDSWLITWVLTYLLTYLLHGAESFLRS